MKRIRVAFTPCKAFRMQVNGISVTTKNAFTKDSSSTGDGNQGGNDDDNPDTGESIEGI